MRPSTNVPAGRGSTVMTTLASGSMVTLPQSGPCAQARTCSRVTPAGRWTVTRTWSAGTVAWSPTNCQYSSAMSSQRFAAPRAT